MQETKCIIKKSIKDRIKCILCDHPYKSTIIAILTVLAIFTSIICWKNGEDIGHAILLSLIKITNANTENSLRDVPTTILDVAATVCGIVLFGLLINAITAWHSRMTETKINKEKLAKLKKQKELLERHIEKIIKELVPVTIIKSNDSSWDINECKSFLLELRNSENEGLHWPRFDNFINAVTDIYEITLALTPSAAIISSKGNSDKSGRDYFTIWTDIVSILKGIHSQSYSGKTNISSSGILERAIELNEKLLALQDIKLVGEITLPQQNTDAQK